MSDKFRQADIEQAIVALEEFDDRGRLPDEIKHDLETFTDSDPLEILGQVLEYETTEVAPEADVSGRSVGGR